MDNQLENYSEQIAVFMKQTQNEIDVPMDVEAIKEKKERKKPKKTESQIFYVAK
tara:strand:- start:592 stop:753 length:162 start_codon:yes stop_codon:yes gene_type:complete